MKTMCVAMLLLGCPANRPVQEPLSGQAPETSQPSNKPAAACPTEESGERHGYSDLGPWIRDCNTPWKREYYRVFTKTSTPSTGSKVTAYVLPPLGGAAIETICKRADLKPTLERYGWCDEAANLDQSDAMTVDDALALAHALHEEMKFVGKQGSVEPYPMPDDIELVCGVPRPVVLDEACIAYTPREGMPVIPSAASSIALAKKLNELYGIP